ncbi:MAG: paraslipin [Bacteriovoracaceae bacterium]|jgi:regulator of protease activity HflC (stomatin/prohibitin superfamily)|nr:paraslipin [Bacteriovoracaceae bacterium]
MFNFPTDENPLILFFWAFIFITVITQFVKSIKLVPTKKAYIVERLGKYYKTLDAGFHALIPFVDKVTYIQDLKERTVDVPPQDCFSRDEVNVVVDGVLYVSVVDPTKASYGVTDYIFASIELAQTTTRSIIGTLDLDRTFEERDVISSKVVEVLNAAGESWGIRVHRYEIKNITPPTSVQDAMEKQVNAEREKRAILAKSEGDKQARVNMSQGHKAQMINISEGEMQKRINEASGKAQEIITLAEATASSIEVIGKSISQTDAKQALELKLKEKYISSLDNLADGNVEVIVPSKINNFNSWLSTLGLDE